MRGDLIAIDLEMTGLDPEQDAILEIGAVRLRDGQIIDEYNTLIDPQRSISQVVSHLTGITDDDLVGKPRIAQVLPALTAFVGDAPLIAHNIGFDLSFLARQRVLQNNLRVDTMELALVLLPRAPRYALGSLAAQLQVPLDRAHRALDDARATAQIYWHLWTLALALPSAILAEIVAAAGQIPWDARAVFAAAFQEVAGAGRDPAAFEPYVFPVLQPRPTVEAAADEPSSPSLPANISADAVFAPEGPLAALLPGYETRIGQAQMARAVEKALVEGHHTIIEAATGIGKTMAYLAPSLVWAHAHDARVVISTSTVALQTQLVNQDVPLAARALGIQASAAVLKGRSNYLCPRRLNTLRARRPATLAELRLLARLLVWLLETESGERQEIALRGPMEHYLWMRLSAADEECSSKSCEMAGGACPLQRARSAAEHARVLIVNHALLGADALSSQPILPPFEAAIIDEAQHLEDAITSSLTFMLDAQQLQYRLMDVSSKTRGLLSDLLRAVRAGAPQAAQQFEAYGEIIREAARAMTVQVGALFESLESLMSELRAQRQEAASQRVTSDLRRQTAFEHAVAVWRGLAEYFDAMSTAMRRLHNGLLRLSEYPIPGYHDLAQASAASARFFSETQTQLEGFFQQSESGRIYWLHQGSEERGVSINSAPLHVGALIDRHLWSARRSVILTGATLRGGDTFDLLRERLGAGEIETLAIPSPYDFKSSVLLYLPTDLPEPNDRSRYQSAVERSLIELATALDGRLLALFTSYAQLRQTAQAIAPRLALGDIAVLDQSDGSHQLALDGFRSMQRAVLMGTRSYWEGVDLPGDLLRGVAIVRLPFSVPTDPIFAARAEQYADPFNQYSVPDAVLKFRQGFGRLIRSAQDRGVVTVLDARILSKGYGRAFLDALPDCTVQRGSLSGLAAAARAWMTRPS